MPTIGEPIQGYYYDQGTDTLRPLAGAGGATTTQQLEVTFVADATTNTTLTAMAAAEDYLVNTARNTVKLDLSGYTSVRFVVRRMTTASAAGAVLNLKYSTTDPAVAFSAAAWTAIPCQVSLVPTNATQDTGWITMPTSMRAVNVYLAVTQAGGDGSAAPVVGAVRAYFRGPAPGVSLDTRGLHRYSVDPPVDLADTQLWFDSDLIVTGTNVPTFGSIGALQSGWTSAPTGSMAVTTDNGAQWTKMASGWVSNEVVRFTSTTNRDTWTPVPNGSLCVTTDTYTTWLRKAGAWVTLVAPPP